MCVCWMLLCDFFSVRALSLVVSIRFLEKSAHAGGGAACCGAVPAAFYMTWVMHVFNVHGRRLREESATMQAVMRELQKAITEHHKTLGSLCDDNTHMLSFASHMLVAAQQRQEEGEMELEFGADERLTGGGDDDDDDDDEKGAVDA